MGRHAMSALSVATAAAASYGPAVKRWQRLVHTRLVVVALLGVLFGTASCPGTPGPAPQSPVPHPPAAVPAPAEPTGAPAPTDKPSGKATATTPLLDLKGVACAASPCAYHPGTAGYFRCLAGGAGACFHFGGPCQPQDSCMFDPGDRAYKLCASAVEGKCQRFGAACIPAGTCWYRAEDRLYHVCEQPKAGGCSKWGALCAPGA
jgi:hypothetical protein